MEKDPEQDMVERSGYSLGAQEMGSNLDESSFQNHSNLHDLESSQFYLNKNHQDLNDQSANESQV